jgi:hypothetical protein
MCACIKNEQVRMDNVLFIPPPPFFEGTRAEFDTTLEDCWYGRVVLLSRVRVKLDKKDGDGRSVRMDIDTAMIECLYDFAPGRCACARCAVGMQNKVCTDSAVCILSALCVHTVCIKCAD